MKAFLVALFATGFLAAVAHAQPYPIGAGTEARQWLPNRPTVDNPTKRYPVEVVDDVLVTARDGTRLDGRLFRPTLTGGEGATPCVLMTDGYGRESNTGASVDGPLFDIASRGYAVMHLSLRGSGKSGGTADLYSHFGQDGYDAIEWMAKQTWCNGRVGMVGVSLLGISEWLTAKQAPPSLQAIIPQVACGDCYGELWYPGGMLPGPGREARRLSPGAEGEYATAIQHRNFDEYWRQRTTLAADNAAIAGRGVAAFIAGGQDDYISPANIRSYEQFDAPGVRKRLFIGPYAHGWQIPYIQELQIQWLDRWLKDRHNGADTSPRVMLYVKGANRWRYEADWPIPDAHATRLFLAADHSGSIQSLNDGSLTPQLPTDGPAATLPYSADKGPFLPVLLSATDGRPTDDQRPVETKVATWTTTPLAVPTEVTGYPHLVVWAGSTATDADLVFSLNDVAADGRSIQVMQGYLNAPHAADLHAAPLPLVPGQLARYELDLFPVAYVFAAGHRIRLAVAGGADVTPGQAFPQGPGKNPVANTWTFPADGGHISTLDLPVIGTAWSALAH